MGGTGDPPVSFGDPPNVMGSGQRGMDCTVNGELAVIPSGGSPDGTGQWPVPPLI